MKIRDGAAAALLLAGIVMLAACTPGSEKMPAPGTSTPPASASTPSGEPTPTDGPAPSGTPTPGTSPTTAPTTKPVKMPTDCKAILSKSVLAQLKDVPLNDPALGPTGPNKNGALQCIWRDPRADTTGLETNIERMSRGDALTMLNALAANEGFTCFTPSGGTRCEKTWKNKTYPVTDGRTLFWRDGIMIDTTYSNLAPKGYTSSIITSIWG